MKTRRANSRYPAYFCRNFLLLLPFLLSHFGLFAQDDLLKQKITIHLSDISIDSALDSIAEQSNCFFTYNSELFSENNKIKLHADNEEMKSVLRKMIPDSTLDFQVVKRHIIIIPVEYRLDKPVANIVIPYVSHWKINGSVVNHSDKSALPYASIGIRGKHIGTISNQDGEFSLTLSSNNLKDTLVVSYVGYKNSEIPVANISDNYLGVKLKEDFISLQEVIIRNNDPVSLIKAAVNKISENYPQEPTNLTSFYRESVQKSNKYMVYLESVLDIYKNPYSGNLLTDRVKIFKSRKIYDVSRLDTISFRLKGGIKGCLMLDIAKHHPEFLDPEQMSLYRYRLEDISTFNNNPVYVIEFRPKPNLTPPLLQGRIFIDTRNLAIVRAEFGYEQSRMNELKNRFIAKGAARTKVRPLQVDYVVSYRHVDGKYYLNHVLGNLKFKVRNKKKLFSKNFSTSFEMATTKLETENVRKFKYRETIRPETVMSSKNFSYDPNFWGNENFINPEESIQEALKRISNSMQQIALGDADEE